MSIQNKRLLRMAGLNDEIIDKYSRDDLNEMAIKKIDWKFDNKGQPSMAEIDVTAREFAKMVILDKLNQVGYWPESFEDERKKMTNKEVAMINGHVDTFVNRIWKMLKPKK